MGRKAEGNMTPNKAEKKLEKGLMEGEKRQKRQTGEKRERGKLEVTAKRIL